MLGCIKNAVIGYGKKTIESLTGFEFNQKNLVNIAKEMMGLNTEGSTIKRFRDKARGFIEGAKSIKNREVGTWKKRVATIRGDAKSFATIIQGGIDDAKERIGNAQENIREAVEIFEDTYGNIVEIPKYMVDFATEALTTKLNKMCEVSNEKVAALESIADAESRAPGTPDRVALEDITIPTFTYTLFDPVSDSITVTRNSESDFLQFLLSRKSTLKSFVRHLSRFGITDEEVGVLGVFQEKNHNTQLKGLISRLMTTGSELEALKIGSIKDKESLEGWERKVGSLVSSFTQLVSKEISDIAGSPNVTDSMRQKYAKAVKDHLDYLVDDISRKYDFSLEKNEVLPSIVRRDQLARTLHEKIGKYGSGARTKEGLTKIAPLLAELIVVRSYLVSLRKYEGL